MAKGNALLKERGRKSRAEGERERLSGVRSVAKSTEEGMPELDRLIHERLRLGIVSALAVIALKRWAVKKPVEAEPVPATASV